MIIRQVITGVFVICLGIAALTGCSRSPRVNFYTMGAAAGAATVTPSQSTPSVYVVNLTLPDLVDRPQLVERINGSRVDILETHRWAEPLKKGILRLLTENLAGQLGSVMVTAYPQNSAVDPDYRVSVDIQRFECMGDTVSVDAIWIIRRTPSGAPTHDKQDPLLRTKTGRSQVHEARGDGYETLVAAYNRAIIAVSNDIARSIRAEWTDAR
ncbi:MAG: PqiC family protein [Desulfuromonadales bacterium]